MKGGPFATGAFQKYPDAPISLRANQGPRGFSARARFDECTGAFWCF